MPSGKPIVDLLTHNLHLNSVTTGLAHISIRGSVLQRRGSEGVTERMHQVKEISFLEKEYISHWSCMVCWNLEGLENPGRLRVEEK